MLGVAVTVETFLPRVTDAVERPKFRNPGHAAAAIRKHAVASIETSDEPSPPGTPPHTRPRVSRKGKPLKGQLPRAITYSADEESAVVGPRHSVVGEVGAAHEFGGTFRGDDYPERSFMKPALEANLDRFARSFAGSIGG